MVRHWVGSLILLALVAACDSPKLIHYVSNKEFVKITSGTVMKYDEEAAKTKPDKLPGGTNDLESASKPRVITPGSRLLVFVAEDPDLGRQYIVPASGEIEFPPLGIVVAEGLTAPELAAKLEKGLEGSYLRSATVSVQLASETGGPGIVYVLGAVARGGPIQMPMDGRFTIFQAILSAGASGFADLKKVKIIRYGMDGRKYMTYANVARIQNGNFEEDLPLQNGDWVMVREKIISW
jgi:protein involved in polysaccharide export with SLBB domain